MTEPIVEPAKPATTPAAPAPPTAPPTAAAKPAPAVETPPPAKGDPDWLPARLQREREAAERRISAELGIPVAEAKEKLAALKALEDEKLSAAERAEANLLKLQALEAKNTTLEQAVTVRATSEMAALSDERRQAVVALAGDDPSKQLMTIEALKPTWGSTPAAAIAPTGKPPVDTAPPGGKAPNPPGTGGVVDHRQVYLELKKTNPIEAKDYARQHPREVYNY